MDEVDQLPSVNIFALCKCRMWSGTFYARGKDSDYTTWRDETKSHAEEAVAAGVDEKLLLAAAVNCSEQFVVLQKIYDELLGAVEITGAVE